MLPAEQLENGRVVLPIVPQVPDDALERYALSLLRKRAPVPPLDDVLREMEDLAAQQAIPVIGPLEGAVIQAIVQLRAPKPRLALDIGGAIGYSALWLARALPEDGRVISIEMDAQRVQMARRFIRRAGFQQKIEVLHGDVMDILPTLGVFDIILQDVIKHVYFGQSATLSLQLLDECLRHLKPEGILLGDNAFCMGEVLHQPTEDLPTQIIGIQAYNEKVALHPHLESIIIPVRDGLWLSSYHPTLE